MRFFWAFVAAALLWAWWLPTWQENDASAPLDVAAAPPTFTPEQLRSWSEEALDWRTDELPDPMVLCEFDTGGKAYLRGSDCEARGKPQREPGWAHLD